MVEQQLTGEALCDKAGNLTDARVALVVVADIDQLHSENDRIDSFDDTDRKIRGLNGAGIDAMGGKGGAEDLCTAFTAEKYDAFIENGKPCDFGRPVDERESLTLYPVKVSEIDGIIALVEGDLLDIYRDI